MAEEQVRTRITADADFSGLIADVHKVTASLSKLQEKIASSNKMFANQIAVMNRSFSDTLRSTGQFSTHFVSLNSDVEKFGKQLDSGQLKLNQYYKTMQGHTRTSGGLIRELAKQQVALQNSIIQPLGRNAQGLMQFNVQVPRGLNEVKNKAALARQELQIMNKVVQQGAGQLINWGKNTQWAGRQLTVGLTLPLAAFGKAAADAFRTADQELTRLTKVYGDTAGTTAEELGRVRKEVEDTAKALSQNLGASYRETLALGADIAATGQTGQKLIASIEETTRLAVLGEVDRGEAMKATLAIQSAFKQNTEELTESINFLNAVENQTSTSLADLVEAIPKAGPVIQGLGGSVQDLALYLTAMREGGINASEGANALKSGLASLINPTKVAVGQFKEFGIDLLGIVNENAGSTTDMLLALQAALDNLDPLKKQQAIENLFGKFQFARMNALFENLGKQGSQTLQVLDLMKASTQDLGALADRELAAVTESASGRYNRAVEGLKAQLAGIGEAFLNINTTLINVVTKVLEFVENMPKPLKQVLTLFGGLTAVAGPLIMLTGVLANFFGYIVKGVFHMKALFKGGEGWKYLTPEILAAEKAGSLIEQTLYSDAKAAGVLQLALRNLIDEFSVLEAKAASGSISVAPAVRTMAGNMVQEAGAGARMVDKNHPLVGPAYSRASSHMNPRGTMSETERLNQTFFGMVPGSIPVNQKIGANPQIYAESDLPNIPGLTRINGASTGIVASEAGKWHAMMATLGMQSQQEIAELKKSIAATGVASQQFMSIFDDVLPAVSGITRNAAIESRAIIAQLEAGAMNVQQARAEIIALNARTEALIAETTMAQARGMGRTLNPTMIPTLDQPVVNATGKSNMRELFKKSKTKDFIDKIARSLGVRTSGAGYNIETTIPKRFAKGGVVYRAEGSDGPEFKPMGTDTVPAMLTPGEFVVKADAVTPETLPYLKALNDSGAGKDFMPAAMMWQGTDANQALAGNRPSINLTGEFLANDMRQLHSRGLHPMALLYDQGVRLGYDKVQLQKALNAAYNELTATFAAKGSTKINSRYFEVAANNIAMKHLKTVTRYSPAMKRQARMAEELMFIGHQRDERGKGELKGSRRSVGFDGQKIPKHLTGTSSGFSGGQNAAHFALAQELYDTPADNLYKGPLGSGSTLSKVFGAERGHIGPKVAPSRWNLLLETVRRKSRFAPIAPDERSIALTNKWRRGYSKGGMVYMAGGGLVPKTQYLEEGGGVKSALQAGFKAGRMGPEGGPSEMGNTAAFGTGMALQMGGMYTGGSMGTGMMAAGTAMQMLPMLQMLKPALAQLKNITGMVTLFGKIAGNAFRIAGMAIKFFTGPIGIATLAIGTLVAGIKIYQNKMAEVRRETTMLNGITAKGAKEAGISYETMTEKLQRVNAELKLQREKGLLSYEATTSSGVSGLTLTIAELKELKKTAKETMPELLGTFNSIDSSKVNDLAANLKAQFVAGGMSVQDATNKIYALIEASNKAGQGFDAIAQKGFQQIIDKSSAAAFTVKALATNIRELEAGTSDVDSAAFAANVDSVIGSLDAAVQSLVGTKDATGEKITQTQALAMQYQKLVELGVKDNEIGEIGLKNLKKERPELASILKATDTIGGMYAKWRLTLAGIQVDLRNINSETAIGMAMYQDALNLAGDQIESGQVASKSLGKAAAASNKLKNEIKTGQDLIKKASDSEAGMNRKQIKAINDKIAAIKKEADAKRKAMSDSVEAENTELELQKLQLEAQSALARGDRDAYAQAQLSIQQLTNETQARIALEKVKENEDKAVEAQQKLLDADAEKKARQQEAIAGAGKSVENKAEVQKQIDDIMNTLTALAQRQRTNDLVKDKNKKETEDKAIKGDFNKVLELLEKSSNAVQNEFTSYVDPKTDKRVVGKEYKFPKQGTVTMGGADSAFQSLVDEVTSQGQTNYAKMVKDLGGGATLKDIVKAMGGSVAATKTLTTADVLAATGDKDINSAKKGKAAGANKGDLTDDAREDIIDKFKLEEGDTFTYDGRTYVVKRGESGWMRSRAVKRAGGGRFVPGQTYTVNDGMKTEGIRFDMPGTVYPNINTAPRYNIPTSGINGMRGGANNASSSNCVYNINIELNGTNVTADDVMRKFEQKMQLVGAKEGRNKTYGGNV
jgi:TP901 family phage tail tape measure protein